MSFEMYTAFRGKVIIKDGYKELVELINTGSWEEAALKFPFVKENIKVNRSTDIPITISRTGKKHGFSHTKVLHLTNFPKFISHLPLGYALHTLEEGEFFREIR